MTDELDDDSLIGSLEVNNINQAVGDVIWVSPKVNGQILKMELDTGSAVSTLPVEKYKEMFPARPWQRIHIDFAGLFLGTMFLIVVDAHSKWPEIIPMASTSATRTFK